MLNPNTQYPIPNTQYLISMSGQAETRYVGTPIPSRAIPHPHPEIVARVLENEAVLVLPLRGQIKVLNELGARIWTLIDGVRSTGEIITTLCQEYDTTLETATSDTSEFLTQLAERGMITFT